MKKYWIVRRGDVVNQSEYLGEFESNEDAKTAAFSDMNDGDILCDGVEPNESFPEYHNAARNAWSVALTVTDNEIEDIPAGLWQWGDEETFRKSDGTEWNPFASEDELRRIAEKVADSKDRFFDSLWDEWDWAEIGRVYLLTDENAHRVCEILEAE